MQLDTELLLQAYRAGYFPMSDTRDDEDVFWVDPPERGVILPESFHVPKRFAKFRRNANVEVRRNTCFKDVMLACGAPAFGRQETWISPPIIEAYCELHRQGHGHSFEVFRDNKLVGGLYGISIGCAFFGESMFSAETGGSKLALTAAAKTLFASGYHFMDTQFWTSHLAQFGCVEMEKETYLEHLDAAIDQTPTARL